VLAGGAGQGSYLLGRKEKSRFELWDVPAMKLRTTLHADERKSFLNYETMAFAPDGKTLAGAPVFDPRGNKILDILDLDGKIQQEVVGKSLVVSVTFSPDGKTVAALLQNHTILFIDPATGERKP
jgi:WD40 repeat protein